MKLRLACLAVAAGLVISGCATTSPELGLTQGGKLSPCPDTPNCVSSDAMDYSHEIKPLMLGNDPRAAWRALVAYLRNNTRYTITVQVADYVRAEARSRLFRFVDDVEFHLRAEQRQIAMRSASRIGYSDLGANRRRLDAVRQALKEARVLATY